MGLEEAEFADALGADAAGGEVGDAAVLELYPDICDVDLVGEHGETDCADFAHWRGDEAQDDVEVVDHQVEDDVYIERAGGKDAKPVRLEEHGFVEVAAR